jgi:predicted permease
MSAVKGMKARAAGLMGRRAADARTDEEFRFHLDMETEANIRAGMSPLEARRRALVAFGGVERHRDVMREARRLGWMEDAFRDTHLALRNVRRNPGFALVAILTIAIGVGGTTAFLSMTDSLLLRPLPVHSPQELHSLQEHRSAGWSTGFEGIRIPYERYEALEAATGQVFSGLVAFRYRDFSIRLGEYAHPALGVAATGDYFRVLGIAPEVGRFFDSSSERSVVLGHGFWWTRFGGDPRVVGTAIQVDGRAVTVAGVAPRGFAGTTSVLAPDLWIPLEVAREGAWGGAASERVGIFGRLRPGLSVVAAEEMVDAIARRIPPEAPWVEVRGARLEPLRGIPGENGRLAASLFGFLLATAVLVLLIGSANIAGMLMARGVARRQEVAVRLAMGAPRARLVRQLLVETLVLFILGALLGVLLSVAGGRLLGGISFPGMALVLDTSPDFRILFLTLALAAGTGLVFGLAPALQGSRVDLTTAIKEGSPSGGVQAARGRNFFVGGQLAVAVVLLVVAGLFIRALHGTMEVGFGVDPWGVVTGTVNLEPHGYGVEEGRAFFHELRERVSNLPGVESASLAHRPPLSAFVSTDLVAPSHDPSLRISVGFNSVDPDFFRTLGVQMAAGRPFSTHEEAVPARVVVVSEAVAQRFWPQGDALGQWLRAGEEDHQVVGVVRHAWHTFHTDDPTAFVFYPSTWYHAHRQVLHVRSDVGEGELVEALRREVAALDPNVALERAGPLLAEVDLQLFPQRFSAYLAGLFGAVGLLLAGLGVYGVLAFQVAQRSREFGVRIALGARRRDLLKALLGRELLLAAAGAGLGLVLAAALTRFLGALLYGVSPVDPLTFAAVPLLLASVAVLASYLPARRAVRSNPVRVLQGGWGG